MSGGAAAAGFAPGPAASRAACVGWLHPQDLQALLVGSVILDGDDEAEFVPSGTDALPACG